MGAGLDADAAADASVRARLPGGRALVLVDAGDVFTHAARTFGAEFDDAFRTGFRAGAAGGALGLVHNRKSCGGIHVDRVELAGGNAVAAAEAAERATGIAGIERGFHLAGGVTVVLVGLRTDFAAAVAADHGDLGGLGLDLIAEDGRHLRHRVVAADRAEMAVQVGRLHGRLRERPAAGEAAAAAVGARHRLLDFVDARVFLYLELLRHEVEDQREQEAEHGDGRNGPDDGL